MKKRILALIALLICNLIVQAGCSQEKTKSSGNEPVKSQSDSQNNAQIKDDLAKYLTAMEQAMKPWSKIDKLKVELKTAKTEKIYASKLRGEFVPIVTGIVAQIDTIKPATKEVQSIHDSYKASIKDYLSGLKSMADAVEKNDSKLVSESAVKLNAIEAARAKILEDTNKLAATTSSIVTK